MAPSHRDILLVEPPLAAIQAGQAIYTPSNLALYDVVVHGISNAVAWGCSTEKLLACYDRHVSGNHLDVGVGTGYFLERCRFPTSLPQLALLDLNPACLRVAARRLARYSPEIYHADILRPLQVNGPKFSSVGLGYLLHCLPGSMADKAVVFDNVKAVLNERGVLFGSTILGKDVDCSWVGRRLMQTYNRRGVFSNHEDSLDELHDALGRRFTNYAVELHGCVAIFVAFK